MSRYHNRHNRSICIFWITCFLLQHCREVLMMNVQQEKARLLRNNDHSKKRHESFSHRHSNHKKKQATGEKKRDEHSSYLSNLRDTNATITQLTTGSESGQDEEIRSVIAVVKNVATKIKIDRGNIVNLNKVACDKMGFKRLHHFWRKQHIVYHLYLISGAVIAELGSCPKEMMNYVKDLVDNLGSKEVIDFLEESVPIIEYIDKGAGDSGLEDNNGFLEPESGEYRHFKQLLHILTDSSDNVHTFSDILDSMNGIDPKEKIAYGIEEKMDEAITEYDIMSSLLVDSKPDIKRKKRSVERKSNQATLFRSSVDAAMHSFSSVSKGKMNELHSKALILIDKRSRHITNILNFNFVKQIPRFPDFNSENYRERRSVKQDDTLVLITNQNFPCEFLTVCGSGLCFKPYDELSLFNMFWVWENGFLKHKATVQYIFKEKEMNILSLKDELPRQKLVLSNQNLFVEGNSNCTVFAEHDGENGNVNLKSRCHAAPQAWSFVNFNRAKSSIAAIACLFLIQNIDTCSVISVETDNGRQHLVMKPIDNQNMIDQVWQWNNQAIRHFNTRNYLSRSLTSASVGELTLAEISNEKWAFENNQLKVLNTTETLILDTTKGKITVNAFSMIRLNLTMVNENEILNCENTGRHFAIKHVAEPCKVLCPKMVSTSPGVLFTGITAASGFVTGLLVGLLSLACSERVNAVKIAFAVGVLFATITAVAIDYSSMFNVEFHTVEFKDYIDAEPLTCLWYESMGTLRSLDNNKSFQIQPSNDGVHWDLRLSSAAEQTWMFQNGSITWLSNDTCRLYFRGEMINSKEHNDNLLFSCENNIEMNSSWIRVYNDDTLNFRKQVTCMYFLRHANEPSCAFMTGGNHSSESEGKPETHSNDNLLNQVWYSRDNSFENVGTGALISENIRSFEKVPFNEAEEVINILTSCHENMFFIKSETIPCKVLTVSDNNGSFDLALNEYSTEKYLNQIWTEVEGHLYNMGTGTKVYIRPGVSSSDLIISNASFIQYDVWHFENQTVIFNNAGCALSADNLHGQVELTCRNTTRSRWSLVQFDKNFSFLTSLLCTFFLQNQNPPCAYLTANAAKELVFLEYMAADVIQDQLWFKSDDRLVNLQSGMSLAIKSNSKEININSNGSLTELKWIYKDGRIIERNTKQLLNGFAAVRLSAENVIMVNDSQYWQFISSEMIMDHLNMFQCHSSMPQFFFLKSEVNPCELLTAINSKKVSFRVFEDSLIEQQLWYIENGRLFNVYTGNVLRFVDNSTGVFEVELGEMLIYDTTQIIYFLQDKLVHVYNESHVCFMSYVTHEGESTLSCQLSESKATDWKRISYNEEMNNVDELLCLFFLKSKDAPCEYLTGYEEAEMVKVRPQIYELINTQLFYWRTDNIVHMQTGLLLTATIDRSSDVTLQAEAIDTDRFFQRWSSVGSQIVPDMYYYLALEVDVHKDGKIILAKSYCDNQTARIQQWWQVPYHSMTDGHASEMEDKCLEDKTKTNSTVFFIRSKENHCLILSGTEQGKMPYFEVFDLDDIERFLWIYDNHHILNFKSGLALMVDFEEGDIEHNVILWPKYAYSLAQKWSERNNGLYFSGLNLNCLLHSEDFNGTLMLQSKCTDLNNSDIEMLTYTDGDDVLNNLICTFFIKSNADHCELLTDIGGNKIRTRPLLSNNTWHQLWYWKGNSLVNYGSNAVITLSNTSHSLMLQNLNTSPQSYTWSYRNSFFKSAQLNSTFMTISEHSGEIVISPMLQTNPKLQQWFLIDRNKGNPADLVCDDPHIDRKLFVIRSEYDSCPLLVKSKDDYIGVMKMSDSFSNNGMWVKDKNHILNVNDGNCLSVKESVVQGTRVILQQKYFYEKLQQWSTPDDAICSMHTNHSQYLTYTGSKVIMANRLADSSDKQRWKWYTVGQIEGNDKLLRCSRCYNEGEETAAEVISYIPVFGWLYNLGRSIAYGAKNCPDVALSSLVEGITDVAFDVIVALSAGTASVFAYGVKTAMKLGIKAGLKAAKLALRSMIKQTFKAVKTNIVKFVRRGLKGTLRNQLSRIRIKSKAVASMTKQHIVKLKYLKDTKLFRLKPLFKKRLERFKNAFKIKHSSSFRKSFKGIIDKIRSSLKNAPSSIQRQADNFKTKAKEKLKAFGNSLADRAENAIMNNMHKLCKRQVGGNCRFAEILKSINNYEKYLQPISDDVIHYLRQLSMKENFETQGQLASACVIKNRIIIESAKEHIDDLRRIKAKPKYSHPLSETELKKFERKDVMHAEQGVLEKMDDIVTKQCKKKTPCKILLYTKLAPCSEREPPNAVTCLQYLTEKCKAWYRSSATKCVIVFKETYTDDIFPENMEETLAGVLGKRTAQNTFGENLDYVKDFAKQNLDKIKNRQSRIYTKLDFSIRQKDVFSIALSDAIGIAKMDPRLFWDALFGKLDNHIRGFTFSDWSIRPDVQLLVRPNRNYDAIVKDQIEEQVKQLIRISFNVEAMDRMTIKTIFDMKSSVGVGNEVTFHRLRNSHGII